MIDKMARDTTSNGARQLGKRQSTPVDERTIRQAQDDRLVDELRQDICRRVGGTYLPTVLSRDTTIAVIAALEPDSHAETIGPDMTHRNLRRWVADVCDFDYNPESDDRYQVFRRDELQIIDFALADAGLEPTAEIETDDPPLAHSL